MMEINHLVFVLFATLAPYCQAFVGRHHGIQLAGAKTMLTGKSKASNFRMMAGGNVPPLDDFEIGTESAVGRILLAGTNEYNHFLMKGTVLVVEQDENGAKGLLLDKQTAFLMGEMVPQFRGSVFRDNKLFTGGEQGPNSIVVLHAARPAGRAARGGLRAGPGRRASGRGGRGARRRRPGGLQVPLQPSASSRGSWSSRWRRGSGTCLCRGRGTCPTSSARSTTTACGLSYVIDWQHCGA
ncbi:unnamed protein product [Heterosigma akashiwo]